MFPRHFTLASLCGATALIAVVVALCLPDREWAAEQHALQLMADKGALVRVYTTGVDVDFTGTATPSQSFTACGGQLRRTLVTSGQASDFGDQDFHLFRNVPKLRRLNLQGTSVSIDRVIELRRTRSACEIIS